MAERLSEQSRPLWSDAGHCQPLLRLRAKDARDRPEVLEQGSRCGHRDARHGGQQGFGGRIADCRLAALSVEGPLGRRFGALAADCKAVQPPGAVALVVTPKKRDAKIDHGEAHTSNRVRVDRAAVEVRSLHEQVGEWARASQLSDLAPQMAFRDRAVEVEDAFTLHDRVGSHEVIPSGQWSLFDDRSKLLEENRDPTSLLVHVDDDCRGLAHDVSLSLSRGGLVALSRWESA
jgi:hypothetical protein